MLRLESPLARASVLVTDASIHLQHQTHVVNSSNAPDQRYQRVDRLLDAGIQIWNAREDVRARCEKVESRAYWEWLMSAGMVEYPEFAALFYPPPPDWLIGRVVGEGTTARIFHEHGLGNWRTIVSSLVEGGFDLERGRLLDFGCGCGRLIRFFARYARGVELCGADVDKDAIGWCAENLEFGSFAVLPQRPPSPYADEEFDGLYAFSIFTHFPETLHRAWLEDLHRICKPGAAVVLTTHGATCVKLWMEDKVGGLLVPSPAQIRADLPKFEKRGYLYYSFEGTTPKFEENQEFWERQKPDLFGQAFLSKQYIAEHWLDLFELVAHEDAPEGWQDFVILRRR
jgi:SAM-dependent methyltransferase